MTTHILSPSGSDTDGIGTGSEEQPFRTPAGVKPGPGDVILVKGPLAPFGTLSWQGLPDAPITMRPYDPAELIVVDGEYNFPTGKISGTNPETGVSFTYAGLLTLKDAKHLIIEGFDISRSRGRGINMSGCWDITFRGCRVHDVRHGLIIGADCTGILIDDCDCYHGGDFYQTDRGYTSPNDNIPGGVKFITTTGLIVIRSKIHNNWCIGISPASNCSGWLIEDCDIWDNYGNAIYVHRAQDGVIRQNLIWNTGDPRFMHAGDPGSLIVLNNESDDKFAKDMNVQNILVAENTLAGGDSLIGIWGNQGGLSGTSDVRIYYNTLINAHRNDGRIPEAILIRSGATPPKRIDIRFNAIHQATGKALTNAAGAAVTFADNGISPGAQAVQWSGNEPVLFERPDVPLTPGALDLENYKLTVYADGLPVAGVKRNFWTVGSQEIVKVVPPPEPPIEPPSPPVEPIDPQIARNLQAYNALSFMLSEVQACKPNVGSPVDARYKNVITSLEFLVAYFVRYILG